MSRLASSRRRLASSKVPALVGPSPRNRSHMVATAILAVLAVLLRLWHIDHGLPDLTEEAFPFRHALSLWRVEPAGIDLNPHWFSYPSLTIYTQLALQAFWFKFRSFSSPADFLLAVSTDPSANIVLGRMTSVTADTVTLVCMGRITQRFGSLPAILSMGLVAVAPALIVSSRLIYADNVLAMFCALALASMLDALERPGMSRLLVAAAWTGLAVGSKYPGALMAVPLIAVAASETSRLPRVATALGCAILVFLMTSPFILVSWPEFMRDARLMQETTTSGTLGHLAGWSFAYYGSSLVDGVGWMCAPLLAGSLLGALRMRSLSSWLPWIAFASMWIPVSLTPVQTARYVLPSLVLAIVLAGHGLGELLSLRKSGMGVLARSALGALLLVQPALAGWRASAAGSTSTELLALRWCRDHVSAGDILLSEAYGPTLLSVYQKTAVMRSAGFAAASTNAQVAYEEQRAYHLVWLPLLVGGRVTIPLAPSTTPVEVFPHAVDWNSAVYNPRLLAGVDFMIVTSTVKDRFASDAVRFARQRAFYEFLERFAEPPVVFGPKGPVEGPTIAIYRLGASAQEAIRRLGPLDTFWWAEPIPQRYRELAEQALGGEPYLLRSRVPRWVESLRPAYARHYGGFAKQLASELLAVGRPVPAKALASSALEITPEDLEAGRVCVAASYTLNDWRGVSALLELSKVALARTGDRSPDLELALAQAFLHEKQIPRSRALLDSLVRQSDPMTARTAGILLSRTH